MDSERISSKAHVTHSYDGNLGDLRHFLPGAHCTARFQGLLSPEPCQDRRRTSAATSQLERGETESHAEDAVLYENKESGHSQRNHISRGRTEDARENNLVLDTYIHIYTFF